MSDQEPLRVVVDEDIADLIPGYLERRQDDLVALADALASGDFESIRILGHSMKGSGGGYGFDGITDIGGALEIAGRDRDAAAIECTTAALAEYMTRLEVIYE